MKRMIYKFNIYSHFSCAAAVTVIKSGVMAKADMLLSVALDVHPVVSVTADALDVYLYISLLIL